MTYVVLSVVVLAVIFLACLPVLRRIHTRPLALTALCLIALTVVFDNLIVGLGIVAYDEGLISGVTMPIAPIEDLAYAIGAVLLVPTLWELLGGRRPAHRPDAGVTKGAAGTGGGTASGSAAADGRHSTSGSDT